MEPIAEIATRQVVASVVQEAAAEVTGSSNRKWAVVLVAFVLGAAVAAIIVHRQRGQSSGESEPQSAA